MKQVSIVRTLALAAALGLGATPGAAQETFHACYVPSVGAIYMIAMTGLPTACLSTDHQEISWSEATALTDGSVTSAHIADGAIATADLADGAVTAVKLGSDVTLGVADGSITTAKLANDAVTAAKLAAGSVGSSEIADNAVGSSEIAADAVGSSEIATDAVGLSELANLVAIKTHTLGWGTNPPCGSAWTSGAISIPGVQTGDQVVMIQMWGSSSPTSSWAHQHAYVDGANSVRVRLTIESTCPGTTTVGATPVVFLVFRP